MNKENNSRFIKSALIGCVIGIVTNFVLILLFSVLLSSFDIGEGGQKLFSLIILSVSAIVCGYFSARIFGSKALFAGLLSGGMYFLILTVLSAAIVKSGFSNMFFLKLGLTALFSALGGILNNLKDKTVI